MLELLGIMLYRLHRKANRLQNQLDAQRTLQPTTAPSPELERELWSPCTREGCKLRFNHAHTN